ncbi:asparagine synthase-related protein [Sphingomonas sp. FW199]|uniref:asparagine synthase-related protein n=1 Tax=Sphingomonas sp. FW199 TaxID=3400217 RepID=UPI003CF31857
MPGLRFFASDTVAHRRFDEGHGVLIGQVFDSQGQSAADALRSSPPESDALIKRYWGSYVVIRHTPSGWSVLRDASPLAACYLVRLDKAWAVTNAPRLLQDAGLFQPVLDWPMIVAALACRDWRPVRTALIGVEEVLPGTEARLSDAGPRHRRCWQAWDHAPMTGRKVPPEALVETIDRCAGAWSQLYRRPLIEISGGLDSAVVAAALIPRAAEPRLITFAAGEGDPTELGYAEAIADGFGIDLEVTHPEISQVDLLRSAAAPLPRPNARAFTQASDWLSLEYGRQLGADCFASGGGGDDLFGYGRSVLPAIDRLRIEGPGPALIRSLSDIARMSDATLWEALTQFWRRLRTPGQAPGHRIDGSFLSAEAMAMAAMPAAPDRGACRMPGKAAHVHAIATLPNHLEGHGRAGFAPVLFPLLSQPIIEHCLAVPSWQWSEGGRNRAPIRQGFAGRLPRAVIERRSKGAFDGFCARLYDQNRALIREVLMQGWLADKHLLDPNQVNQALAQPVPSAQLVMRLLALIDVEAWIRSWAAPPLPAGPAARPSVDIARP